MFGDRTLLRQVRLDQLVTGITVDGMELPVRFPYVKVYIK